MYHNRAFNAEPEHQMNIHDTTHKISQGNRDHDNPIRESMDENTQLIRTAADKPSNRLLQRLFPNASQRMARESELKELETGFEFRQRALRMAIESRLQAIEEACNHVLVTGKSEIRRERQEFFAEQVHKLAGKMHEYAERFNLEIDGRLGALDKYENEAIRKREEGRLYRQLDNFHAMLDEMAKEFENIIHEGVKS